MFFYLGLCLYFFLGVQLKIPGGVSFQDVQAFIEKMVTNIVRCKQTSENE